MAGVADAVRPRGCPAFGPARRGRALEGSKAWMKDVMRGAPASRPPPSAFDAADEEPRRSRSSTTLAGPVRGQDRRARRGQGRRRHRVARRGARGGRAPSCSGAAFGDAGRTLVIEERLTGPEVSLLVLCDGATRGAARRRAGLQARSATATRARTPAAWARTRPVPGRRRGERSSEIMATAVRADAGASSRRRGVRVPRRAVRRPDARRPTARRCSSTTCASATPSARSWCPGSRATSSVHCCGGGDAAASTTPVEFADDACVGVVLAAEGYPADAPHRRRDRRPRRGRGASTA